MTPQEHNRLIGILFHVQGGLQVLGGLLMVLIYGGIGGFFLTASGRGEDQIMGGVFVFVAVVVGVFVFLFAGLDFYAGYKVGKVQPIGRILGIVVAFLSLLSFPLGTALGVYALWFFFGDMGKALYNVDGAGGQFQSPPPPPNSWQ